MMLLVGDPHVRPDNLPEQGRLFEFVAQTAKDRGVSRIIILGDLFHTHKVIRMEVQKFWESTLSALGAIAPTYLIAGNHDQPGDDQKEGAMSALDLLRFLPNIFVVSEPVSLEEKYLLLPHTAKVDKFAGWLESYPQESVLFCHQTFNGAAYENGFYAKDGFDLSLVARFDRVISGHIHKAQTFANVIYPGTPRWDSINDANENKGIWLYGENSLDLIPTNSVCMPIHSVEICEGQDIPEILENSKTHIRLVGTSSWIASVAKKLKGKAKISVKPTDTKSSGDPKQLSSFEAYAAKYKFEPGISADDVIKYIRGTP